ncbi:MAG TPA: GNAT family N-acetyltransferase [Alicycliphilus sp.]|nr:GNAT family N-acetyltransferase [Alicycliphilus sp.]
MPSDSFSLPLPLPLPLPHPHLCLRDPQAADAPCIGAALRDPRVAAHYGLVSEAHDALATGREQLEWMGELQASGQGWWQVIASADGALVGAVGAYERDDDGDSAELGFWLRHDCWRQGLMQHALRLFVPQAFVRLRLHSLVAYVEPANLASQRLLRACGFHYEGLLRECTRRPSGYVSLQRFSLLHGEVFGA